MRNLTILLATFAMAVLLSFGCGGSGGGSVSEEWTGPTSTVIIEGRGDVRGLAVDADGNVFSKDASGTTTGSGDDTVGEGVDSILDVATMTCTFITQPTTPDTGIHVVDSINKCTVGHADYIAGASLNKCIVCTATSGATCELTCNGTVPSNAATAADWVKLKTQVQATFESNMPAADGAIRIDGDTTLWPEFDPSGVNSIAAVNYSIVLCDGDPDMLAVDDNPLGLGIGGANTANSWNMAYSINGLGINSPSSCTVLSYVWGRLPLTGADTPGALVDLTNGSFTASGKICDSDTAATCPAP